MSSSMKYAASNGGPLIALPAEVAEKWRGTDAPEGVAVPPGWEWGGNDDDPIRTDYDRACGKLRARHQSSYGGIGLLKVGDGDALVFLCPTDTTFLPLADGGVFLRNVPFASASAAKKALETAPKWKKTRIEIALRDGRIFLFDAAYPYRSQAKAKAERGRPAGVTATVKPGRYRVLTCDWMPPGTNDYELRAYRLERT